jgi:kumamolisin
MKPGERIRDTRAMQAMVAAGISMFAATGDWGAFTCWAWNSRDHRESTWWPASSEYVVGVGGTNLTVREDGGYGTEAGWEDWLSTAGTGGGLSGGDARPAWQVGAGVDNERSDGRRQVPDVSATADIDSGYLVFWTNPETDRSAWSGVGGTSASAPFWAASMLLIQEASARLGLGRLGYVNPMLYAISAQAPPNTVFHDIVEGGNLAHRATPGWDYATGLGSPDVTMLAGAIVEYLRANPSP